MMMPSLRQIGEERTQFTLRVLMMLVDGEVQGGFEKRLGLRAASELQEKLAEENARHHPVRFFGDACLEVRHGLGTAVFRDERLGEAETK